MFKSIVSTLMLIAVFVVPSSAAKLEKSAKMNIFINKIQTKQIARVIDINSPAILESEEFATRPVIFEIINSPYDEKIVAHLSTLVEKPIKIGFNSKRGMYHYNNVDVKRVPLKVIDEKSLQALQLTAAKTVANLLGKDAARFEFANTETIFILNKGDTNSRLSGRSYRFTRKINGRHILDNSSYVRISFSGNDEISSFEIVNPDLVPIEAVKRMVKLSATEARFEEYVRGKRTALKNGTEGEVEINVTTIKAENGFDTYLTQNIGGKMLLIPNVSFYSEYQLENGESFENWAHFCLDADKTQNIEPDMIENLTR